MISKRAKKVLEIINAKFDEVQLTLIKEEKLRMVIMDILDRSRRELTGDIA